MLIKISSSGAAQTTMALIFLYALTAAASPKFL